MKIIKSWAIALMLLLCAMRGVQAQICLKENFDLPSSIVHSDTPFVTTVQWRASEYAFNSGVHPSFLWDADGAASDGEYWDNREAIRSNSSGGAVVIDADAADFPSTYYAFLFSPEIPIPNGGPQSHVFLSFSQYYRAFFEINPQRAENQLPFSSYARVEICTTGVCQEFSEDWMPVFDNDSVGSGVETINGQRVRVNITSLLYDAFSNTWASSFRVRFSFEGGNYFWIIDDVSICEENPFPPTFPAELGEKIYPDHKIDVDSRGGAYVPDQLMVEFEPGTEEVDRRQIRESLGVDSVARCSCNLQLELWLFNQKSRNFSDTLAARGDTLIKIQEVVAPAKSKPKTYDDGVGFNYYVYNDFFKDEPLIPIGGIPPALDQVPEGVTSRDSGEIVLAHPDTGIDYFRPDIAPRLWRNEGPTQYPGDLIGHNFVDNNNNVLDDNGHGIRTFDLMSNQLPFLNCPFKIMALKTHDDNGVGTLFNNTCALYYALNEGADVVLLSWGWIGDGEPNNIVKRAIDKLRANGVIVVSAAGNHYADLDTLTVNPGAYQLPNQINVGSVSDTYEHSEFSNYSETEVHIGAPGENLRFIGFDTLLFNGTSYAAPQVAAAVASIECITGKTYPEVIPALFECSKKIPALEPYINEGLVLDPDFPCFDTAPLSGQLIYALTASNTLISFDSETPSVIRSAQVIREVQPNHSLVSIDVRPFDGQLFALSYQATTGQARLYTLEPATGLATPVGTAPIQLQANMGSIGMDFDPTTDQIRVVGSNNAQYKIDPITGTLLSSGPSLAFATGDVHANKNPAIGAIAHSNNVVGASITQLFAYDDSLNVLARITSAESGILNTLGPTNYILNPNDPTADLDIYTDPLTGSNVAYLAANTRNSTWDELFEVNLETGLASPLGQIGGGIAILDIAAYLKEPELACETKIVDCVKFEVLSVTQDAQNNRTYRIRVTNDCAAPLIYTAFGLPKGVTAVEPSDNSVYHSVYGHNYLVRNPGFSPFYSVKFQDLALGIQNGQSDVYTYTLPAYVQVNYVLVRAQLSNHSNYETYLSLFGCATPAAQTPGNPTEERSESAPNQAIARVFPNPVTDKLWVDVEPWNGQVLSIRILNSQGQWMMDAKVPEDGGAALKLPDAWPQGLYFIEIVTKTGYRETLPFVLQR